jgi:hypothetical protein
MKPSKLAKTYRRLLATGKPPPNLQRLWTEWLWGTDCVARGTEPCGDMNEMQVLGLLLCFAEALQERADKDTMMLQALLPSVPLVHLHPKPIAQFSLRELTTQIECLQLSWGAVLSHSRWESVGDALRRLMARLGFIAHHAFPPDTVLDDPQHITPIPGQEKLLMITTRKYIRQMVCILLVLFRHAHPLLLVWDGPF